MPTPSSLTGGNPKQALFFKVNCFTPLRFHFDMIRYFAIKECIEIGCPPDSDAAKDYFPIGYTFLLLTLSKLGILKSFYLVLVNCIYLFTGLYLTKKIFEAEVSPFLFYTLALLNWTLIKFAVHPLSEMQYLFLSMSSLYFFYSYTKNKKLSNLVFAFGLGGLAFLTRTVGVTLVFALIAGLLWEYRKQLSLLIKRNKTLIFITIGILIAVLIFSRQLGLDHYTGVMSKQFKDGTGLLTIFGWHFTELTEISLNLSIARINALFSSGLVKIAFIIGGFVFIAAFIYLLYFQKNRIPFIVKCYMAFYGLLLFNWPFYDPRFWVPVIPVMVAVICQASYRGKWLKAALAIPLFIYICSGVVSIGYITYTSFNKEVLARKQANGVYRNEYEIHFYGKPQSDTAKHIDPFLVHLLDKHD
jgi:hypothetical protein